MTCIERRRFEHEKKNEYTAASQEIRYTTNKRYATEDVCDDNTGPVVCVCGLKLLLSGGLTLLVYEAFSY